MKDEKNDVVDVKFVEVFTKAVENQKSDDDIKMLLLKAGAKFSTVNSIFNKLMIDGGLRLNRADKLNAIGSSCKDLDLTLESNFNLAVDAIVKIAKVSSASASGSVRAWAKSNGVECFTKPRGGNGQGQSGFMAKFQKALAAKPNMDDQEVDEYINTQPDRTEGSEVSANVVKNASLYRGIAKLVNAVYKNAMG